ncbi:MAG: alpha/beta hydrolase [Acutalibacteraceae bacterium]|nr:alpha/beta hydrolase [Acutalibacteraceae bacterium]
MTEKKNRIGNILKIVRNIIFVILIIAVIFVLVVFIFDRYQNSQERALLEKEGYVNLVSAGDYNLNARIYGKENGEHTIVGLSGMGTSDYAVGIRKITDSLADKNKIVVIDRAGYGLSDDTFKEQTIEQIISDYRTVLKNAGCKAPYVLMAHSLGGVYASYWESTYPDEIEAVIYLDTTEIGDISFLEEEAEDWDADADEFISALGCKIGLYRVYDYFEPIKPWGGTPEEDLDCSKAFCYNNPYSFSMYSEVKLSAENITTAYNSIKKNDIPKLYIDAICYTKEDMIDMIEYIDEIYISFGLESELYPDDEEKMQDIWENLSVSSKDMKNNSIDPYMEMLGNCKYVNIPGYHSIYLHKPNEVTKECIEFLDEI